MSFPCPTKENCAGSDDPLANLSSEGYDQRLFFSIVYSQFSRGWCCDYVATSFISQEDADRKARALALLASEGGCDVVIHSDGSVTCVAGDPDDPINPDDTDPSCATCTPPVYFHWSDPTGSGYTPPTRRCTGGLIYQYDAPPNIYGGRSQAEADRIMQFFAEQAADRDRFCCTAEVYVFCLNVEGFADFNVTGGTGPFTWTFTGLPDGLETFSQDAENRTMRIWGIPITAGLYTVQVEILNVNGNKVYGTFQLGVCNIIPDPLPTPEVGVDYDEQLLLDGQPIGTSVSFAVIDGELPDGLTLESDGRLHGTPEEVAATFTVEATFNTGESCTKEFSFESMPDPIRWYKFDELAEPWEDSVSGGADSQIKSIIVDDATASWDVGKIGNCVHLLNGISNMQLGQVNLENNVNMGPWNRDDGFAACFWFNFENYDPTISYQIHIIQNLPDGNLVVTCYDNKIYVGIVTDFGDLPNQCAIVIPFVPDLGVWNFICYSYDPDTGKVSMKLNDAEVEESATTYFWPTATFHPFFTVVHTMIPAVDARDQILLLDELGIFNATLTPDQMDYLYNDGDGVTYPI